MTLRVEGNLSPRQLAAYKGSIEAEIAVTQAALAAIKPAAERDDYFGAQAAKQRQQQFRLKLIDLHRKLHDAEQQETPSSVSPSSSVENDLSAPVSLASGIVVSNPARYSLKDTSKARFFTQMQLAGLANVLIGAILLSIHLNPTLGATFIAGGTIVSLASRHFALKRIGEIAHRTNLNQDTRQLEAFAGTDAVTARSYYLGTDYLSMAKAFFKFV